MMYHEIVIQTGNLDTCRYFYREILQLGEVIMDSNSFVMFKLTDQTMLTLEACSARYLEHASGAVHFAFECCDVPALAERLKKDAVALSDPFDRMGRTCYRGCDPDGNAFIVIQKD
ncbi:MAG: VOC family protein [Lentisphaeria bacterium]|nr:VOC family protein [Lentisphaeria bacterium]